MIFDHKTTPDDFRAIWKGKSAAILRREASGIGAGSIVRLREYDPDFGFTGRCIKGLVKHASTPAGLRDGWLLLSLKVTHRHQPEAKAIPR